ncbi:MAG: ATPase [Bacteroidia bacterium]|nr:ATPase [Bacteroidia bacterium]
MKKSSDIKIKKASGEEVYYDSSKLEHSLFKAGATQETTRQIIEQVEKELYPGIPTYKIYQRAFSILRREGRAMAARYKLKRAIMELGPSGFPFEKYIGELLKKRGFEVEVGVYEKGKCISHEIDVLGDNGKLRIAVECKFGAKPTKRLDVKIPLYIDSRFRDIANKWSTVKAHKDKKLEGWIVTNGEFTDDAQKYGTCAGLHLISWSFPERGNLKDLIDASGLYPLTSLTSITKKEKKELLSSGMVLAKGLLNQKEKLSAMSIPPARVKRAIAELEELCWDS